jgi:hypothetical protein
MICHSPELFNKYFYEFEAESLNFISTQSTYQGLKINYLIFVATFIRILIISHMLWNSKNLKKFISIWNKNKIYRYFSLIKRAPK